MKSKITRNDLHYFIQTAMAETGVGYSFLGNVKTWEEAKNMQEAFEDDLLRRIHEVTF